MTPTNTYVQPDFCAVMPDDSMAGAGIYSGDMVYFVACDHVENGQIAAVRLGEIVMVRRVEDNGKCVALIPANPVYSATSVDEPAAGVEFLGRLVESRHRFDEPAAAADTPP